MTCETKKQAFKVPFRLPLNLSDRDLRRLRRLGVRIEGNEALGIIPAGEEGPSIPKVLKWGECVKKILGSDPLDQVREKENGVRYGCID